MLDNGFKGKKKFDFGKWITGGNSKIYLILMIVVFVFLLFALKTVIKMHQDNINNENGEATSEDVNNDITEEATESESNYVATNMSYCIKINKSQNFAVIYQMDENQEYTIVVKAFKVSVSEDASVGETFISRKALWWKVSDTSYCRYASKLDNSEVLYSAAYYYNETDNSLNKNSYNNIGNASLDGSIHMTVSNAKWIYENCGINTPVYILDNFDLDEGVTLEEFETISSGYRDPTDTK